MIESHSIMNKLKIAMKINIIMLPSFFEQFMKQFRKTTESINSKGILNTLISSH